MCHYRNIVKHPLHIQQFVAFRVPHIPSVQIIVELGYQIVSKILSKIKTINYGKRKI
jgi:hypothetical protein